MTRALLLALLLSLPAHAEMIELNWHIVNGVPYQDVPRPTFIDFYSLSLDPTTFDRFTGVSLEAMPNATPFTVTIDQLNATDFGLDWSALEDWAAISDTAEFYKHVRIGGSAGNNSVVEVGIKALDVLNLGINQRLMNFVPEHLEYFQNYWLNEPPPNVHASDITWRLFGSGLIVPEPSSGTFIVVLTILTCCRPTHLSCGPR
jgi:hypothetical protein